MEKILSDFGINPILFAAQIVNFVVLVFVLKKLLYKPVLKLLDERKQKIEESLANAEKIQKELEETEVRREEILNKSIEDGKRIVEEATASAGQIVAEAHTKAQADMQQMMDQGMQMIAGEKEKMKTEVKAEVASMIQMSMEKVLGGAIDSKSQQKLVEDAVKTIKS